MRHLSIAVIAAASTIALTQFASAADMPVKARRYAPPPPPPPVISWNGWYAGLNAGYNWSNSDVDTVGTPGYFYAPFDFLPDAEAAAYAATTSLSPKQDAFIGGGQIGYNWQFAPIWVAGLEADIQGLANNNHTDSVTKTGFASDFTTQPYLDTITSTTTASKKVDWLGTVRARLGVLATPSLLVYGTGGLAYGDVKATTTISQSATCVFNCATDPVNYGATGSISKTRAGWTAGGGLEWLFAPQWSVRAEYLYYDLGKETITLPDLVMTDHVAPGCGGGADVCYTVHSQSTVRFNGNIVRAAINYHF